MIVHNHCKKGGRPALTSSLYRGVQRQFPVPLTRGEDRLSDSVGGLLCVSCVWRNFICRISRMCKGIVFGWQPSPLVSYQCSWDLITRIQGRTKEVITGFCWSKYVWTSVYMSNTSGYGWFVVVRCFFAIFPVGLWAFISAKIPVEDIVPSRPWEES